MSVRTPTSRIEFSNLPVRLSSLDYDVTEYFEVRELAIRGQEVVVDDVVAAAWRGVDRSLDDEQLRDGVTTEKAAFEGALEELEETFPAWFDGEDPVVTEAGVTKEYWGDGNGMKVGGNGNVTLDDRDRVAIPVATVVLMKLRSYLAGDQLVVVA